MRFRLSGTPRDATLRLQANCHSRVCPFLKTRKNWKRAKLKDFQLIVIYSEKSEISCVPVPNGGSRNRTTNRMTM